MRTPDLFTDGWRLEDVEALNREAPATFHIPDLAVRQALYPGAFAKLVFTFAVDGDDRGAREETERLWVIVRECLRDGGYMGMLDNEPTAIFENGAFWLGAELPFEPRHVIEVEHANEASLVAAGAPAPISWPRD
jgi:hypothetical protein